MHHGSQEKSAKFLIEQDGQPHVHSSRLSKIFEFWTNFDLEYISSCEELSFHTRLLCRTTSWKATP